MDTCRLSINANGAFWHPLGDQTPIDCRYGETINSCDLPHRQMAVVEGDTFVKYGGLNNPRAVIVWNVAGLGLQTQPTEEEVKAIAGRMLLVGVTGDETLPTGWQLLRPAIPGQDQGGSTTLWLAPGTRVVLRPAFTGARVPVRVLVIPGDD